MNILISACLLGTCCRYDGASKMHPLIAALAERHTLVPVCPEQLGGLPTPRPPAERRDDRVVTESGAAGRPGGDPKRGCDGAVPAGCGGNSKVM